MNLKHFKVLIATLLVICMLSAASNFVLAADNEDRVEFIIEDITEALNTTALKGESKVKVSVKGDAGIIDGIDTTITFGEGLKYSSIQFLAGASELPKGYRYSTPAAQANAKSTLYASIAAGTEDITIEADKALELFILTFTGEPDAIADITVDKSSFCIYSGKSVYPEDSKTISAKASSSDRVGVKAGVKLTLDVVKKLGSVTSDYKTTNIYVKLINKQSGYTIFTDLSNASYPAGNRYDNGGVPVFLFETEIVGGTYTVELSGQGYVPFSEDVSFSEAKTVEYTNAQLIPGDVSGNGVVDIEDKTLYEQLIAEGKYLINADFNRDGAVNEQDNMFANIKEPDVGEDDDDTDTENTGNQENTGNTNTGNTNTGDAVVPGSGSSGGGGGGGGGAAGGMMAPNTPQGSKSFTDLAGYNWAENAIYSLKNKGIITGVSATDFAPANNIKRGDFILILSRVLKLTNTFADNFADVPAGSYYYNALGMAKAAGIASGDGINFMPEASITREDLITLSYRAFLNAGYIAQSMDYSILDNFSDKSQIADYATAPMASMVAAGIIKGSGDGVNPKGYATRAEVAVMCERLLALIK